MMHDCFSKIAKNPYLFPAVSNIKSNYHKCVCGVDAIYYKIVENRIVITTIIGRQDFEIQKFVHWHKIFRILNSSNHNGKSPDFLPTDFPLWFD